MADEIVDTSQLVGSGPATVTPPVAAPVATAPAKKARRPSAKKRAAAKAVAAGAGADRAKAAKAVKGAAAKAVLAASIEGAAAYQAAKLNQVDTFDNLPTNTDTFQLRFASRGEFVHGAIDLKRDALVSAGAGRVTYTGEVDFSMEGAPALVTEAWLIAANGEGVCCDLGPGLTVGGGHHAKIPARHLLF